MAGPEQPALHIRTVTSSGARVAPQRCPILRDIPNPKELPPERLREVRDVIERKVKELLGAL